MRCTAPTGGQIIPTGRLKRLKRRTRRATAPPASSPDRPQAAAPPGRPAADLPAQPHRWQPSLFPTISAPPEPPPEIARPSFSRPTRTREAVARTQTPDRLPVRSNRRCRHTAGAAHPAPDAWPARHDRTTPPTDADALPWRPDRPGIPAPPPAQTTQTPPDQTPPPGPAPQTTPSTPENRPPNGSPPHTRFGGRVGGGRSTGGQRRITRWTDGGRQSGERGPRLGSILGDDGPQNGWRCGGVPGMFRG